MEMKDWLTLIALILGPTFGVVISLIGENIRERRRAKYSALISLLANRHTPLSDDRVRALNSIDLVYRDNEKVRLALQQYLAQLAVANYEINTGAQAEGNRLLLELTSLMAMDLGYKSISQVTMDRAYYPKTLFELNERNAALANAALQFFKDASKKLNEAPPPKEG